MLSRMMIKTTTNHISLLDVIINNDVVFIAYDHAPNYSTTANGLL